MAAGAGRGSSASNVRACARSVSTIGLLASAIKQAFCASIGVSSRGRSLVRTVYARRATSNRGSAAIGISSGTTVYAARRGRSGAKRYGPTIKMAAYAGAAT